MGEYAFPSRQQAVEDYFCSKPSLQTLLKFQEPNHFPDSGHMDQGHSLQNKDFL